MSSIPKFTQAMATVGNKYGYKIKITHPKIFPLYQKYRVAIGEGAYPISDKQRYIFESQLIKVWRKRLGLRQRRMKKTEKHT